MLGWHANRPANAGPTHCPKCCEEFDAREAGLIDWRKFPPYFTQDSIERGIFKPESETHATPAQIRSLLSDAEYYADSLGPDQCPAGLVPSARRVIEHCRRALNGTGRDSP